MAQDEDFAAMFETSLATGKGGTYKRLSTGDSVQVTVVQIGKDAVFVDAGTRAEAEIARYELENEHGELTVKVGDRLRATVAEGGDHPKLVMRFNAGSGLAGLETALEAGAPVEGTVSKAVKAGLEVQIGKIRAFCPASHVHISFTPDISIYEGQTMQFKVLEIRDNGRSVVVSRKALLQDERAITGRATLESLSVGQIVEGTVQAIQPYGAFIDLGGIEGLIHVSELGHGRVDRVEDVVTVGEQIRVKVLSVEQTAEGATRIGLSLRQATQLAEGTQTASAGADKQVVDAEVVKVEAFGVFVETATGGGIVPTRELDLPPGGDPRRAFPVGKQVQVVAIGTDEKGRTRFSMRRVEEEQARSNYRQFRAKQSGGPSTQVGSFGDLLKAKLSD
ncbi:SSU ribosomal protein S1p [Enhygromyxa salina]|uniref:SSU ribosomal protein S1p n=1 Tax=Enhygromyxa salina TaxID=215803 RepID=A0A0C1Z6R1_9BACT|nr:S1 RNA-binding domain-containing protein [Enhygromyxa salina]KIG13309.1 SSU ribosomal protein S1p [Enhygromyxa salina]